MPIKIQNERPIQDTLSKLASPMTKTSDSFSKQIGVKQDKLQTEELTHLLKKIDEEGQRLLHHQTIKDLNNYKKSVHKFVQEAVRYGLDTQTSRSWHQQGGSPQTLVKRVDQKLMELTDDVLNKSSKSVDLLGKIGEIKGLLVNLYI